MTRPLPSLVFLAILTVALSASTGRAQVPATPGPVQAPALPYPGSFPVTVSQVPFPGPVSQIPAMAPPSQIPGMPPASPLPVPAPVTPSADILEGWPKLLDEPKSLFWKAPTPMPYACAPLPGRYFENDPQLDPPQFHPPGFVAGVEVQAVVPHIFNTLANGAPVGTLPVDSLQLGSSGLNWGVSPRLEAGYRLGSGFGEFLLSYRYLGVTGSTTTPLGQDGPANLRTRFDLNVIDFDYASREFTPWQHVGMKWRIGMRMVYLFYDNTLTPSGLAAGESGILQEHAFNDFKAFGGHVGLELSRDLYAYVPGLSAVAKFDYGSSFTGTLKQGVSETTIASGYEFGGITSSQSVPMLAGQFGVSYEEPGSRLSLFAGGFYEYWWNVGRLSTFSQLSRGELSMTGVTVQLKWNY